ncbi:DUF6094 domain-containing protein [Neisseria sp. Ec49-e6-T10]|uniref:DUF6094 domain-containing protein n=1 Tax=Neisseria sp. Ec49-e6-T10 TaxID=3140744 RepID=UPI003EBB86E2
MSLMFSRLAHNFAKNGYYPAGELSQVEVHKRLDIEPLSAVRVFDPCCGEGTALAEIKQHLLESCAASCHSIGVELNEERALHSKKLLDQCIHSDIEDVIFQQNAVGLLFLNPPYGLKNKDSESLDKSERLEEIFFRKTFPELQYNGILVLLIPSQSLTERFASQIASSLIDITIGKAPEGQFNQVIIMGRRIQKKLISRELEAKQRELILSHDIAPRWCDDLDPEIIYTVPSSTDKKAFKPISVKPTAYKLSQDFALTGLGETLWPAFERIFPKNALKEKKAPLCSPGQWHTALALAAGQVTGVVKSNDGTKQLLIKGRTYKQQRKTTREEDNVVISESKDIFVPTIKAIDITKDSETFGNVLTIS